MSNNIGFQSDVVVVYEFSSADFVCLIVTADREGKGGEPNFVLWHVETGTKLKAIIQKKQIGW